MTAALFLTAVTFVPAQGIIIRDDSRPSDLAPSVRRLSKSEQARIERVINRFIDYERGKLSPRDSAAALHDFNGLGSEAVFQLIDGLNRAAASEVSCAAITIARKLGRILSSTQDIDLLDFARENIGSGVRARRHMNTLKDLRLGCAIRKGRLQRANLAAGFPAGQKGPGQMTVDELANAAGSEHGIRLKAILVELEKRSGPRVLNSLGAAAAGYDPETQQLARGLLDRHLRRLGGKALREALKADQAEVRMAAAKVVGSKRLTYGDDLIDLLSDADSGVRQAARQALVQLSRGLDYGPEPTAGETARAEAVRQWRAWWDKQARR
jgi:hypothetical protein